MENINSPISEKTEEIDLLFETLQQRKFQGQLGSLVNDNKHSRQKTIIPYKLSESRGNITV